MEYLHTNSDGTTTKYTDDMIKNAIADRDYYRNSQGTAYAKLTKTRDTVYEFFKDRYDSDDEEITVTVDDVNELLDTIGASKLKALFTVTGTINFVVTDIEAESEEDANDIINNALSVDFGGDGNLDDWDIDITDTTQQ